MDTIKKWHLLQPYMCMCVCMHLLTCACSRAFQRTLLSVGGHQTGTCSVLAGVVPNETQVNIMETTDTYGYKDL